MKSYLTRLVSLTALILAIILQSGCIASTQKEINTDQILESVPSVKLTYNKALETGASWRTNALLAFIQIRPTLETNTKHSPSVMFSFESPEKDGAYYVVHCFQEDCIGEEYFRPIEGDNQKDLVSLVIDEKMLDSKEVLKIALERGGENYLGNQNATVLLTLRFDNENNAVWDVYFGDYAGIGSYSLMINANTGEVLQIE